MTKPLFAILRHKKLRTMFHVRGAGKHNDRTTPPKHARKGQDTTPVVLHGPAGWKGVTALLTARIAKLSRKPRRDQVRAIEEVLTASPKYFKPDGKGGWDKAGVDAWVTAAMEWLRKTHGDRLMQAVLHLDEKSPHIHAVLLPEVEGRLCAKEFTAPHNLKAWQSSYAEACAPLGLVRGVPRAGIAHTPLRDFYEAVEAPLPPEPKKPRKPSISVMDKVTGKAKQKQEDYDKALVLYREESKQYLFALRAKARAVDVVAPDLEARERALSLAQQALNEKQHVLEQKALKADAMADLDYRSKMNIIKTLPRQYLEQVLCIPLPGKRDAVDILRDRGVVSNMREGVDYVFNAMAAFDLPQSTHIPPGHASPVLDPLQRDFAASDDIAPV